MTISTQCRIIPPKQCVECLLVSASEEGNCVTLSGVSSLHEGLKGKVEFQGRLTANNKGGEIACADGILSVEKADEAIIYVSIATNFNNYQDIIMTEKSCHFFEQWQSFRTVELFAKIMEMLLTMLKKLLQYAVQVNTTSIPKISPPIHILVVTRKSSLLGVKFPDG